MKKEVEKKENGNLIPRPPIVVVMGHIDHGKTTLLDFIRKTNAVSAALKEGEPRPVAGRESGPPSVAAGEAGGITQHIGAYEIVYKQINADSDTDKGGLNISGNQRDNLRKLANKITFIDTPGHEAFSKMRLRGARIADLAILVVASDDGVKAQTIEAINAIKQAKIPFIVAINKIDKENADPERAKRELAASEIYLEGMGGTVPGINISAKTGQGIPELLEMILLLSEMEELKADPKCLASGVIVESHLDSKRGISATLIIQNGTLEKKMFINAGGAISTVKIFEDFLGRAVNEASFSSPVRITGFDKIPEAGTNFRCYKTRNEAEKMEVEKPTACPIAGSYKEIGEAKITIPIIIKADVSGSLEALEKEIMSLATPQAAINILRLGAGDVNEDDVKLSPTNQNAIIIGFRVKADSGAIQMAEKLGIMIVFFDIIYKVKEWFEAEIKKRTPKTTEEEILGSAELIKVFSKDKNRQIIGGRVIKGKIINGKYVKISRRGTQIAKGRIIELQHDRMKTGEVEEGKEFGALVDVKSELAKGDLIEIYNAINTAAGKN